MHELPPVDRVAGRATTNRLWLALSSVVGLDLAFLAGSAWGRGRAVALVVAFTALTGYADSQGFVHASRIWGTSGQVLRREMVLSGLAFVVGIGAYWIVIRFATELGVGSAVLQTMGWFAVTIAAVVLTEGGQQRWDLLDTATAAVVVSGLGLLLYRTAA
jgi:hypothetical protein